MIDIKKNLVKDIKEKYGLRIQNVLVTSRQYFYKVIKEFEENKKTFFELIEVFEKNNIEIVIYFSKDNEIKNYLLKNKEKNTIEEIIKKVTNKNVNLINRFNCSYSKDFEIFIKNSGYEYEFKFFLFNKPEISKESPFVIKTKAFRGNINNILKKCESEGLKLYFNYKDSKDALEKEITEHKDVKLFLLEVLKINYIEDKNIGGFDRTLPFYLEELEEKKGTLLPLKTLKQLGEITIKVEYTKILKEKNNE